MGGIMTAVSFFYDFLVRVAYTAVKSQKAVSADDAFCTHFQLPSCLLSEYLMWSDCLPRFGKMHARVKQVSNQIKSQQTRAVDTMLF